MLAFLRWYMEKRNITQSRLAVELGTSQPIVSRWFRCKAISDLWCFVIRMKLPSQYAAFEDEVLSAQAPK